MSVQVSNNNANLPFVLHGVAYSRGDQILLQDAGRSVPLVFGTVMARIAATQKWVPLTDLAAVNGSALGRGIYIGADIAAAALVAGDVVDNNILTGGALTVDEAQIVLENSLTLESAMEAGTINERTIRDQLVYSGIFAEDTVAISSFENA